MNGRNKVFAAFLKKAHYLSLLVPNDDGPLAIGDELAQLWAVVAIETQRRHQTVNPNNDALMDCGIATARAEHSCNGAVFIGLRRSAVPD